MKTVKTDEPTITLSLGEHIPASQFDEAGNRVCHVAFIPLAEASQALVDVANRRIVWLDRNEKMCWDPRICGGKIKAAISAYEKHYRIKMESGSDAPGESRDGLKLVGLTVRDGEVTSHQATSQKYTYQWDWATESQVKTEGGRKY